LLPDPGRRLAARRRPRLASWAGLERDRDRGSTSGRSTAASTHPWHRCSSTTAPPGRRIPNGWCPA